MLRSLLTRTTFFPRFSREPQRAGQDAVVGLLQFRKHALEPLQRRSLARLFRIENDEAQTPAARRCARRRARPRPAAAKTRDSARCTSRAFAPRSVISFLKRSSSLSTSTGMHTALSSNFWTQAGSCSRTLVSSTKVFTPAARGPLRPGALLLPRPVAVAAGPFPIRDTS